jgi:uncharacterized protein (TIGR02271 family)
MPGAAVVREDGMRGRVVAEQEHGRLLVEFSDGTRLMVSSDVLLPQTDGSYRVSLRDSAESDEIVIPVLAEELTVETHRVARGKVQIHKRIETREELVDTPHVSEQVVVERIAVNKLVEDVPPEPRTEDGVLIIPLIEEILVVEKRLLIREEVRVSKRRTTTNTPQKVVLRREVIDIERQDLDGKEQPEVKRDH